jgi:hypothetical protein
VVLSAALRSDPEGSKDNGGGKRADVIAHAICQLHLLRDGQEKGELPLSRGSLQAASNSKP